MIYIVSSTLIIVLIVIFLRKKNKEETCFIKFKENKYTIKYYGKGTIFDSGKEKIKDPYIFVADENNYMLGLTFPFICYETNASSSGKIDSNKNIINFLTMTTAEKRSYFNWLKNKDHLPDNLSFLKIYIEGLFFRIFNSVECFDEILEVVRIYKIADRKTQKQIIKKIKILNNLNKFNQDFLLSSLELDPTMEDYWIVSQSEESYFMLKIISLKLTSEIVEIIRIHIKNKISKYKFKEVPKVLNLYGKSINYIDKEPINKKLDDYIESFREELKMFIVKYKKTNLIDSYHYLPEEIKREYKHPQFNLFKENFSISKIYNIKDFFFLLGEKYEKEETLSMRESKALSIKINDFGYNVIPDPHISKKNFKNKHQVQIFKSKENFRNVTYNNYYKMIGLSLKFTSLNKDEIIRYLGDIVNEKNLIFFEKSLELLSRNNSFKIKDFLQIDMKDQKVKDYMNRIKSQIKDSYKEKIQYP